MKYTQTISTEYHPCEILPVVFGASSSATTSPAESGRSTSGPTSASVAAAPSNPVPDHLPPGCVLAEGTNRDDRRFGVVSQSGDYCWMNPGFQRNPRWIQQKIVGGWATRDWCLANPPTCPPPDHQPSPVPPPSPVAPAVEQAGTVDAKYVEANAGKYTTVPDNGVIFESDQTGYVSVYTPDDVDNEFEWDGVTAHGLRSTRFRPLPSPSANPPETPDSSGEPVNPWSEDSSKTWREYSAWNRARDEFRTYHAAQLSALRAERDAMQSRLAATEKVLGESKKIADIAHAYIVAWNRGTLDEVEKSLAELRAACPLSTPAKSEKGGAA